MDGMKREWFGPVPGIKPSPAQKFEMCDLCGEPTGRCGEDSMVTSDGKTLCESCWDDLPNCCFCRGNGCDGCEDTGKDEG